jgi:hypothetical protein
MLPPGHRVVGLRQADGMPHEPQRARSSGSSQASPPSRQGAGRWGAYRARLAVDSRIQSDSAGHNEDRPSAVPAPVSGRFCCVAGHQGFEPWKACADGFTARCREAPVIMTTQHHQKRCRADSWHTGRAVRVL